MRAETKHVERLNPQQKQRYTRQVLLAEIGEAGQLRLCGARVRVRHRSDPHAAAVASDYLLRAGLETTDDAAARELALPDASTIQALAGSSGFEHAAAALAGAFCAVEAIKATLGAGVPAALPPDLVLSGGVS
jgi:hypothetical protein